MIFCPSCGEENPERFRLCGFCGTPLIAETPRQEVRKTVTVVFSDLKGSTSLGERLDSEALREVMSRYFEEMSGALELHGGTIEKYIGDAIMAVFGLPVVHEDDALRAVRAAAEMKRRLETLNDELDTRWGVTLVNRTGVNTGEVVADQAASSQRLVTGDTVNVAARLEQAAPALETLIGEPTYELVRDDVEVEPVEPLELKGKSERIPAYRLVDVRAMGAPVRSHRGVFVGRKHELARLDDLYREAEVERASRSVTILAEAGVGKTRLLEEFERSLKGHPLVLRGRCLPYGRGITFWPLGEIVRSAAGISEDDPPPAALEKLRTLVGTENHGIAEQLGGAIGLVDRQFPIEELFFASRRFFEVLAESRPVVTLWEDLHWAEATLLELVERLATAATAPLFLVCTARPSFLEIWQRGLPGERIDLEPLGADEAEEFIDTLLDGVPVDARLRRTIVASAEGNPLYAEQMLSMLVDDGVLRRESDAWVTTVDIEEMRIPPTIHALLEARLDGLAQGERSVIDAASVIGLEFAEDAVQELVPEALHGELRTRLDTLVGKQLLRPSSAQIGFGSSFRFEHILIRDAAYGGLLKRTRATLHERVADWGERVNEARQRGVEYEEIQGYHLEQAFRYLAELGPVNEQQRTLATRAAAKLSAAGNRAFAREDMPAAANLLRRAADLMPEGDLARLALLPDLSSALTQIGELAWAEAFLTEAVDGAKERGERALGAEARLAQLTTHRFAGGDERNWCEEVLTEVETAVPLFELEDDHRRLAKAWRVAMSAYGISYRFGDAAAAAQRAVEHARLAGDVRGEAFAASAYAMAALYGPTPVGEAIARCAQTLEEAATNRKMQGFITLLSAPLYAMQGDFETGRTLYRDARRTFEEIGATLYNARTSLESSTVELLAGNPEEAERELRRDYTALEAIGERYLRSTVAGILASVLCLRDRTEEAAEFLGIAEEIATEDDVESQALCRSVKASLLAREGQIDAADDSARAAVELLKRTDALVKLADALLVHAGVLGLAGRTEERNAVLVEAAALYRRKGNTVSERAAQRALREPSLQVET
jgi:class 3 adenylate cyclase/tetratricopeptide (TPR) repeat protein